MTACGTRPATLLEFSIAPAYYQTNWFKASVRGRFSGPALGRLSIAYAASSAGIQATAGCNRNHPGICVERSAGWIRRFHQPALAGIHRFLSDQALGWGWADAVHPEDRARLDDAWRAAVASGDAMEAEARMRSADGQYRWLLFRSVPLRDRSGKIVKWYGKSTDIEDRKRAEQERERLRQLESDLAHINRVSMMGELAASVAHEVNQPLTGIVSNGSACLRLLAGDAPEHGGGPGSFARHRSRREAGRRSDRPDSRHDEKGCDAQRTARPE